MKVLLYNWCQFDDVHMAGGGVSLYLRNIIRELAKRDNVEVYFLSAGRYYSMFDRRTRIEPTENAFSALGVKSFQMLNSPVKAPAHDAFHSIDVWQQDHRSVEVLQGFLHEHGPFDVLHFHNLEGISANVLSLEKGQDVKSLFYTFHNYMPVCPQIELLYQGKTLCESYFDGNRCVSCMGHNNQMKNLISFQRMSNALSGRGLAGTPAGNFIFGMFSGLKQLARTARTFIKDLIHGFRTRFQAWRPKRAEPVLVSKPIDLSSRAAAPRSIAIEASKQNGHLYQNWRESNGAALKYNVDGVFAVSDLARDTAERFLPEGTEVISLPLPMDFTTTLEERRALRKTREKSEDVTLSFVGYGIPSKGLPFLVEALGGIDDPYYREHVHLKIVARLGNTKMLTHLRPLFKSVTVVSGYSRSQIVPLSKQIDLNIVPSIWWETFNQVTVELGLLGVPSLVSDRVGAKQTLANHEDFVFEAQNTKDFLRKLDRLVKDRDLRENYAEHGLQMPSISDHIDQLLSYYTPGASAQRVKSRQNKSDSSEKLEAH
ncbi:Glycosyl transferases group 1 [Aliiroseovarius halocynthiae]|uniref:Glycosyltransferase family 4 protein n=1 Tax=Aliiroseovarius halocynthiae TaxID=985055 RepID=A0A545SYC3_9RHOB|nr:glycosyltransferase family 4 protein [Aliiroseovarius halocynthiae]TQV69962.1 glycosyltransferase family 4 protein [Aliiroseovarius halocynthiae]SMR70625.1 Glycosyl transferases group 1 [Aliiroseovarius halocynthiae]